MRVRVKYGYMWHAKLWVLNLGAVRKAFPKRRQNEMLTQPSAVRYERRVIQWSYIRFVAFTCYELC